MPMRLESLIDHCEILTRRVLLRFPGIVSNSASSLRAALLLQPSLCIVTVRCSQLPEAGSVTLIFTGRSPYGAYCGVRTHRRVELSDCHSSSYDR